MTRSLWASIVFHMAIIAALLGLGSTAAKHQRNHTGMAVKAYVITQPAWFAAQAHRQHASIKPASKQVVAKKQIKSIARHKHKPKPKKVGGKKNMKTINQRVSQGQYHRLLIALHNHIQAAISAGNYLIPDYLKHRGATVCFDLDEQGRCEHAHIETSSHSPLLDRIALAAVAGSAPVTLRPNSPHKGLIVRVVF